MKKISSPKRCFMKKLCYGLVCVCMAVAIIGCPEPNNEQDNPNVPNNPNNEKSNISGKVSFANPASSGIITLYLEKTDGFHSGTTAVQNNNTSRKIGGTGAKTTTAKADGSYTFNNIDEGIYTIYAASEDEAEQAVLINIPVVKDTLTTTNPMILKPVGSIKGRIVLDSSNNVNLGFTVFIAGTSYMAMTNQAGNFEISNVPEGESYEIAVVRGNYATIWTIASVESGVATDIEKFNVTSAEINGDAMI